MGGQQPADKSFWGALLGSEGDSLRVKHRSEDAVRSGGVFQAANLFSSVADNGTAYLMLVNIHRIELTVRAELVSNGKAYGFGYEGVKFSDEGTSLTIRNPNTNPGAASSQITAFHTPTITDFGNLVHPAVLIPANAGPHLIGNEFSAAYPIIVRPGGNFLFVVQNKAGSAQDASIFVTWTESATLTFTTTTTTTSSTTTTTA